MRESRRLGWIPHCHPRETRRGFTKRTSWTELHQGSSESAGGWRLRPKRRVTESPPTCQVCVQISWGPTMCFGCWATLALARRRAAFS